MHFISLCSHQISKQYIFSGHVLLLLTAASVIRILLYLYGPLSQMHCRCSSIFCLLSLLKFKMDFAASHLIFLYFVFKFLIAKCIPGSQVHVSSHCDDWKFGIWILEWLYGSFGVSYNIKNRKIWFKFLCY